MARVRRDRFHAPLAAVQRLGDKALAGHPEVAIEAAPEAGSLNPQVGSPARQSAEGAIQVALDLAQRSGAKHVRPVHVRQRVVRILPTLVAGFDSDAVFEVAVAVFVAIGAAPFKRGLGGGPELVEQGGVDRPVERFGEDAEKQRGRIDRAVEDVRPQASLNHLAVSDLVQDFARLLLGPGVHALPLVRSQKPQGAARDVGVQRQRERRREQGVATKWDGEPGHATGWIDTGRVAVEQHAHVVAALFEQLVERLVVRFE